MNKKNEKVLVLGSYTTRDYAVIRGLGLANIDVVASVEKNQNSPFVRSRFVKSTVTLPDKADTDKWIKALASHLQETDYDLVVPPDDYTCHAIHNNRWLLDLATIALPEFDSWENVYHKERTFELAEEAGIPVSKGFILKQHQEIHENLDRGLEYPVVVKPLSSKVETPEGMIWLRHKYAYDIDELSRVATGLLGLAGVSVQEYCPGVGLGVGVLARKGKLLYCFQWLRVHEPVKGGASSYRVSVPLDDEIVEASKLLVEKLNWTGVAMIEYRYDATTRKYWLMEVNGRFWGSLPLAIASHANFPHLLYQMYAENTLPVANQSYQNGIYCRNLDKDLVWFVNNFKSKHDKYSHHLPLAAVASEIKQVVLMKERFDEINIRDPLPGLITVKRLTFSLSKKVYRKIRLEARMQFICNSFLGSLLNVRLRFYRRLSTEKPLLFVCFGNICRSPFAQYIWLRKTGGDYHAIGAGYGGKPGRTSPKEAIDAAKEYGIDLEVNRSLLLDDEIIQNSSLIFCMDRKNIRHILEKWPQAFKKTFLLGNLGNSPCDIPDPYRKDVTEYSKAYTRIDSLIETLIKKLKIEQGP